MKVKKIKIAITKGFGRLERRQRMLVILLVAAILFNLYYTRVFRPQWDAVREANVEFRQVQNELMRLKSRAPDIKKDGTL